MNDIAMVGMSGRFPVDIKANFVLTLIQFRVAYVNNYETIYFKRINIRYSRIGSIR